MNTERTAVTSRFSFEELSDKTVAFAIDGYEGAGQLQVDQQMTAENTPTGKIFVTVVSDSGLSRRRQFRCSLDQRQIELLHKPVGDEAETDFLLQDDYDLSIRP